MVDLPLPRSCRSPRDLRSPTRRTASCSSAEEYSPDAATREFFPRRPQLRRFLFNTERVQPLLPSAPRAGMTAPSSRLSLAGPSGSLRAMRPVTRRIPRHPSVWATGSAHLESRALHYELLARVRKRDTALALGDALAELADRSVRAVYGTRAARPDAIRGCPAPVARPRRGRESRDPQTPRLAASLGELASSVGCSPFTCPMSFAAPAGISLRRYAQQLRARIAADRLARGARDLTELALDLGYTDHSHFTNAFRREWGLPPSRFRAFLGYGRDEQELPSGGRRTPLG